MPIVPEQCAAIAAWDLGPILTSASPAAGTINATLLFATPHGRFVLRGYHHATRDPIVHEHAIIAHAVAQRLPVPAPVPLPGGGAFLDRDGHFFAVFPHAPGEQRARVQLSPDDATAMGHTLARLHRALRSLPPALHLYRRFDADRPATLARIERLEAAIRARQQTDPLDAVALRRLAAQRAALEVLPDGAAITFDNLPVQVIHGDYQEANLFFFWPFEAYYLEGNARVRQYLLSPDFVPVADQWDRLRSLWRAQSAAANAR